MKTLDEYMRLPYRVELVQDTEEGGYVASFPELKGCITCAETVEAAMQRAEEAKRAWLAAALEMGYAVPEPVRQ
jgi:predicted RNase H-like HicB family nuclease